MGISYQYDVNVIPQTSIKFSFLLNSNKISIIVYLAIKKINENSIICVPVSFLVDRYQKFEKIIK